MNAPSRPLLLALCLALTACGGDDTTDDSAAETDTDTDTSAIALKINKPSVTANCMPVVPDDPIAVSLELVASHDGSGTVDLVFPGASLTWGVGGATQAITVTPSSAGVASGEEATVTPITKTGATDPLDDDCGYCNEQVRVTLTVDAGAGASSVESDWTTMSCVY